jgi:predicted alpha/beta-fold hydrolase
MQTNFIPPRWGRNPHLQTIWASLNWRLTGGNPPAPLSESLVLPCLPFARLAGVYWRQPHTAVPGLVLIIHGWLGGADSAYVVSLARYLYERGYEIFRLNLRDHGRTEDLNPGLFHGARLAETIKAVELVSRLKPDSSLFLVGFSLGGNFALRIAINQGHEPIANLRRVFAISPALDPEGATKGIDMAWPGYRWYFLKKWKRSLQRKERFFPGIYDFSRLLRLDSCMAMTSALLPYFPDFTHERDYFERYTIRKEMLAGLVLPTHIFAAADDPVLPRHDLTDLISRGELTVEVTKYGGHCGFFDAFPNGCWYERRIAGLLAADPN